MHYFYLITGISNITSDQESVFTVSNLVRKIKFESGSVLRPTPARAQVPNDCLDGTLYVFITCFHESWICFWNLTHFLIFKLKIPPIQFSYVSTCHLKGFFTNISKYVSLLPKLSSKLYIGGTPCIFFEKKNMKNSSYVGIFQSILILKWKSIYNRSKQRTNIM